MCTISSGCHRGKVSLTTPELMLRTLRKSTVAPEAAQWGRLGWNQLHHKWLLRLISLDSNPGIRRLSLQGLLGGINESVCELHTHTVALVHSTIGIITLVTVLMGIPPSVEGYQVSSKVLQTPSPGPSPGSPQIPLLLVTACFNCVAPVSITKASTQAPFCSACLPRRPGPSI